MKTFHIVSNMQLLTSAVIISLAAAGSVFCVNALLNYLDLPDVHVNPDGKCISVVNYKNGDGFQCHDKDVVLRKYHLIVVSGDEKVSKP